MMVARHQRLKSSYRLALLANITIHSILGSKRYADPLVLGFLSPLQYTRRLTFQSAYLQFINIVLRLRHVMFQLPRVFIRACASEGGLEPRR